MFSTFIDEIANQPDDSNPKGKLQEHLQSITQSSPSYSIISQEGPDHEKSFVSQVSWEGTLLGEGAGKSKKEAEINAASNALESRKWVPEKTPQ